MATTEHFYTGNNSTTDYSFTFPYLLETDIKVTLDTIATTAYTLPNSTTIRFNSAPATGVDIHIYRDTNVDTAKAVFAAGSSVRAADLNDNQDQVLYALQEEQSGQITNSNILPNAEIEVRKLKDGTARQLIQTDAAGTGVEWTSNIDVPGTLDVTGAVKCDSTFEANGETKFTDQVLIKGDNENFIIQTASGVQKFNIDTDTGNVTLSGTVDGRDIATDGTKLDGIESGATADQTNAEIRTAVEAASDSNVFTDADHSKLNAIEASADVTDATNVNAAGAVMNSDLDGKGELLVGDGSGDPSALTVGTNDYVLTADSGEATGVKWAAAPSLTVQDEGSALSTAASIVNFTGSGVTATGTGATKTVNIPGATSGASAFTGLSDTPGSLGSAGQHIKVNSSGNALEFTAAPSGTTNLSATANGTSLTVESSSGTNVALPAATTSAWGVMSDDDKTKLDGIETSADVTDATNVNSAGAVMNSDLATKGQILVGDGSGDPTALSVGSNNQVLTADSSQATGVKWGAVSSSDTLSFRNILINGATQVSQIRGTTSVSGEGTLADMWKVTTTASANSATMQVVNDGPPGFQYSQKITMGGSTWSPSAANVCYIQQNMEATNVAQLAFGTSDAKTITLSFWVKASQTGEYSVALTNNSSAMAHDNADRNYITSYTISSANTCERKSVTIAGDTSGTWAKTGTGSGMCPVWDLGSGTDHEASTGSWQAGADFRKASTKKLGDVASATWQITGAQLEIGSSMTDYEMRPTDEELRRCQRYYQKFGENFGSAFAGKGSGSTTILFGVPLGVPLRASPTVSQAGNIYQWGPSNSGYENATVSVYKWMVDVPHIKLIQAEHSTVADDRCLCVMPASGSSTNPDLAFTAEL